MVTEKGSSISGSGTPVGVAAMFGLLNFDENLVYNHGLVLVAILLR